METGKCRACFKEVDAHEDKCPHCGADNPLMSTAHLFFGCSVLLLILAALVTGGFFCFKRLISEAGEGVPTPEKNPLLEVTASQLIADFRANEVAAEQKYKGKLLLVQGEVSQISIEKNDRLGLFKKVCVVLHGGAFLHSVNCKFSTKHSDEAAKLKKGDKVKIVGHCSCELNWLNVDINDCEFAK